jgi:signal transduction histidine kinase
MPKLYVIEGPGKGKIFDVKKGTFHLGRGPENHIQVEDPSISQTHLKIEQRDDRTFVEDLKSTNGTFINGEMIEPGKPVEIMEGSPISIGNTLMVLDREFSIGGTLVHHTVRFPTRHEGKDRVVFYKDRPMTNPTNLQLMYKISNVLMESFDINEVLEKVMEYLFECLSRIDRGAILLYEESTGNLSEIIARSRNQDKEVTMDYSRTIVNRVIRDGKPVSMSDTSREEDVDLSDSMKALKIRSVMCVPLISRNKVRGAIYVDSLNIPHGFRKEDLYLLMGLGTPAAIAIENALLYANLEKLVKNRTRTLRQTEKRLRKSEARFRAIFDNMKSGVAVFEVEEEGRDFVVVELNRFAREIEDIRLQDVVGRKSQEIFPEYESSGISTIIKRVWKSGVSEHIGPLFHGEREVPVWRDYDVYKLPSGEIVVLFNDLTAQKRAEKEQSALQKRFLNAQKLESVGRLAGGVAHNFRNILQAILGNVEYMEMVNSQFEEVNGIAKNISNSIDRGVDLVNSLLHFSRVGVDFNPVVMDLSAVLQETYRIVEQLFDKKIQVSLDIEKALFVRGNHSLLSQVFMNLFTNARDAMPGGGRLIVKAKRNVDHILVVVSDTGYGMDKKTLDQAFDPFFTGKDVGKGTGLGLSTAHGIVEEHGGGITVSSSPGKGTTFKIRFPLAESAPEAQKEPEKLLVTGKGQKVLIVDDELSALDALVGMTRSLGYTVASVSMAVEALKQYREFEPDVVLMDRNMPEIDGISCIREIMKLDRDARIIIVSGYESSGPNGIGGDVRHMIKGYLTKPCGMNILSQTLSEVLGK